MKLVFAGTPEVAVPALDALIASGPARGGRRRHPARRARRTRPQAGRQPGRRSGPRRPGSRCSSRSSRGTRTFLARLREIAPGLLPGRRLRRAAAQGRPRHPRPRLGQSALLAAARLARRRARAARGHGGRRDDRRLDLPDRGGARLRPGLRGGHREGPAHRHQRRSAHPARLRRRRAARRDHGRHRGRHPEGRAAARRGRHPRAEDHRRGRPGGLDRARRCASTGSSAAARPRPAPGRSSAASGSS